MISEIVLKNLSYAEIVDRDAKGASVFLRTIHPSFHLTEALIWPDNGEISHSEYGMVPRNMQYTVKYLSANPARQLIYIESPTKGYHKYPRKVVENFITTTRKAVPLMLIDETATDKKVELEISSELTITDIIHLMDDMKMSSLHPVLAYAELDVDDRILREKDWHSHFNLPPDKLMVRKQSMIVSSKDVQFYSEP